MKHVSYVLPRFVSVYTTESHEGRHRTFVRPEGIEPPSHVPKTRTLSVKLWALISLAQAATNVESYGREFGLNS